MTSSRSMLGAVGLTFLLVPWVGPGSSLSAQVVEPSTHPWAVGASIAGGLFVDSDVLDSSLGADVALSRRISSWASVRADGMLLLLSEHANLGESADNRMVIVGIGPEVSGAAGWLAVYARGFLGRAGNFQRRTRSTLDEKTTWATVWGGGGGVRSAFGRVWSVDFGADLLRLGELDFARAAPSDPVRLRDPVLLRIRAGVRREFR